MRPIDIEKGCIECRLTYIGQLIFTTLFYSSVNYLVRHTRNKRSTAVTFKFQHYKQEYTIKEHPYRPMEEHDAINAIEFIENSPSSKCSSSLYRQGVVFYKPVILLILHLPSDPL